MGTGSPSPPPTGSPPPPPILTGAPSPPVKAEPPSPPIHGRPPSAPIPVGPVPPLITVEPTPPYAIARPAALYLRPVGPASHLPVGSPIPIPVRSRPRLQMGTPSSSRIGPSPSNPFAMIPLPMGLPPLFQPGTPSSSRIGPPPSNPIEMLPLPMGLPPLLLPGTSSSSRIRPPPSDPIAMLPLPVELQHLLQPGTPSASQIGPSTSNPIPVPLTPLIHMDEKPGRGRIAIATRKIEPGEVIMIDNPHMIYPANLSCVPVFCANCFRMIPSKSKYPCDSCKVAYFCSRRCLAKSHPHLLCHALPHLFDTAAPCKPELLFLLVAYSLQPNLLLQLLSLQSNPRFKPDDDLVGKLHIQMCSLIPQDLLSCKHVSYETTYQLLSKEKNNSFPLLNPRDPYFEVFGDGGVRAYGFYIQASIFNNDCLPNICVFNYIDDPGRENNCDLIFRATQEIEEGEELCINYLPVNRTYRIRKRILMECYGFECNCMRCDAESQWKENQEQEEEDQVEDDEDNIERTEWELKKQKWVPEKLEAEEDDVFFPHDQYLDRYVCDCGGCLASFPPSDDRARLNLMECNCCSGVRKDWGA